jgi:hypothetical protein
MSHDDRDDHDDRQRNGKLNLSHLTPEEIAKRVLETPPPSAPRRKSRKTLRKQ